MIYLTPVNGDTRHTHFQIMKQHNFQHCTGRITWRLRLAKPHILGKLFPLVKKLGPMEYNPGPEPFTSARPHM